MAGGVSGYAALNARVRVMYSTLLTQQQLGVLYEAVDFNGLISALKSTRYATYLEKAKDKELTARRAAFQIRARLTDEFYSIIHNAPEYAQEVLAQRLRYYEVDNLEAVLRGILAEASWDKVRFVLFPLGSETGLRAQEMVESASVSAAVELLRGTPYYETLSYAMKRYAEERNLFPLEVALDLHYWRGLWKLVNQLPGDDRRMAVRIVGELVDTNNLMWVIRYRIYHHLSEEELINYTLPFGFRVRDEQIRAIAAGVDIAQVVKRIYPDLTDVDTLLQEPRKGLPELELKLKRHVMQQCASAFVGSPFHIGLPLAYLQLLDLEIQDLTVLMEAKSAETPIADLRGYLMMGQNLRA